MSTVIVRMKVKPEHEAEFLRMLRDVADIAEAEEEDCRCYAVWKAQGPHEYLLVESYRTRQAREAHEARHAHLWEPFMNCLDGPPETETLGDFAFGFPA